MANSDGSGGGGKPSTELPSSKLVVIRRADISDPVTELVESRRGVMAERILVRFCVKNYTYLRARYFLLSCSIVS